MYAHEGDYEVMGSDFSQNEMGTLHFQCHAFGCCLWRCQIRRFDGAQ
jgi:hypothetical protein